MLIEEPESADQTRRWHKIFFLCDMTGLWALIKQSVKDDPAAVAWGGAPAELVAVHRSTQGDEKFMQENLGYEEQRGLLVEFLLGCLLQTKWK